jgi:hypothetical protein
MSSEYKAFEEQVKEEAQNQKCSPHDLRDRREWPGFKW